MHKLKLYNNRKKYRADNKEKFDLYRLTHKDAINKSYRKNYHLNSEKEHARSKKYYYKNWKKERARHTAYLKTRYQTDPSFRIRMRLSGRINNAITSCGGEKKIKTEKLLGCSFEFFRQYIEKKFQAGMNWDNYGYYGWHVDHIKPCSSFNLLNEEEQYKCFNYTNLQPLWWKDNIKKGNKLNGDETNGL